MEVVINKKTYVLKPINQYRRELFIKCVLPFYNNNEMSKEQYIAFDKNVHFMLWEFIKNEDKKEIGIQSDVQIEVSEIAKVINWINKFIEEYCKYIKENSNGEENVATEKIETVFAFLSKQNGWTPQEMQEMDELVLLKALKEACDLSKKNNVNEIKIGALIGAFSSGSKHAKRVIDEMNREEKFKAKIKQMKNQKVEKKGEFLTDEQLRNL